MNKKNWLILGLSVFIVLFLTVFLIGTPRGNFFLTSLTGREELLKVLSPEEVSSRIIQYIDNYFIQGAIPINLIGVTEESGVYKIELEIDGEIVPAYATKDGRLLFPEGIIINEKMAAIQGRTIGGFIKTEKEVCLEEGKPIVYYFGMSTCPFCVWQEPIITAAMEPFQEYLLFKNNNDTSNDLDIFAQYSEGPVPLIVIGCRYFRVGAGKNRGTEAEDQAIISALACQLTGGRPQAICEGLNSLIEQI